MADDDRYQNLTKSSFKVNIFKYSVIIEDDDSGKSHIAEINVAHDASKWKLNKSYNDFSTLHDNFTTFLPVQIELPSLEASTADNLNEYIAQIISCCDSKIWDHPILLRFLDDMYGKSSISKVQLNELSKKVFSLEEQLEATIVKNVSLVSLLMELNERVSALEANKTLSGVSLNSLASSYHSESKPSSRLSASGETTNTPLNSSDEGHCLPMASSDILIALESSMHTDMDMGISMHRSNDLKIEEDDFSTVDVMAIKVSNAVDLQSSSNIGESITSTAVIIEPDFSSSYDKSLLLPITCIPTNKEPNEVDNIIGDLIQLIRPHDEQIKYRKSIQLTTANFIKRNIGCRVFDSTLFAVKCFLPDDGIKISLVMSRTVPTNWFILLYEKLSKLSSDAGGGSAGGFEYNDLTMTKDNNNNSNNSPDNELDEVLSDIDIAEDNTSDGFNTSKQSQQRSPYYNNNNLNFDNNVSNVSHSIVNEDNVVTFNVGLLQVEIACNPRMDLAMLAFLEEFSHLVGKDFLFKRCFLLVRAWWVYETAAYIGCPMKHYLSDAALSIMLCAVFNLYHEDIHTPFQGLCIFLAEYGDFDWTTYVITLQGIVPFKPTITSDNLSSSSSSSLLSSATTGDKDMGSNVPWLKLPKPHHLVNEAFIHKYKNVLSNNVNYYNTSPRTTTATGTTTTGMSTSFCNEMSNNNTPKGSLHHTNEFFNESVEGGSMTAGESNNTTNNSNNNNNNSQSSSLHTSNHVNYQQQLPQPPILESTLNSFERLSLNIVNPFTHTNMIGEKLNSRRAKRVIKVFQMGARNLCSTIKSLPSFDTDGNNNTNSNGDSNTTNGNSNVTPIHIPLLSFFRNIHNRFGSGWRPDVINKSLPTELILHRDLLIWTLLKSNSNKNILKSSPRQSTRRSIFEYLWNQVNYCNVVQDSIVNDLGLLILCKEILNDRGTLPVGEIGKNLQEIGKISSNRLKEKFGGLKKFLERYPDDFVVSTDHPFNPHVFLRQLITQEDVDSIYRGVIPKSLLERMDKLKKLLTKKKTLSSSVLSLSDSVVMDRNSGSNGSAMNGQIYSSMDQSMVQRGYLMSSSNGVFNSINNNNNSINNINNNNNSSINNNNNNNNNSINNNNNSINNNSNNSINNINNNISINSINNMASLRSRQGGLTVSGSSIMGSGGNTNFIQQSRRKNGILTTSGSSIHSMNINTMMVPSPANSSNNSINLFSTIHAQRSLSPTSSSNNNNWNNNVSGTQQYSNPPSQQPYHNLNSNSLHDNSLNISAAVDRLRMEGGRGSGSSNNNSFSNSSSNNNSNSNSNGNNNSFNRIMINNNDDNNNDHDDVNNNESTSAIGGLRKPSSSSTSSSVMKEIGVGLGFSNHSSATISPSPSASFFSNTINNNNNNNNVDQHTLANEFRGYYNHSDNNNHHHNNSNNSINNHHPNKFDDQFLFNHIHQQQNHQQLHQVNSAVGSASGGSTHDGLGMTIGYRSQFSVPTGTAVARDEYITLLPIPPSNNDYNIFQK